MLDVICVQFQIQCFMAVLVTAITAMLEIPLLLLEAKWHFMTLVWMILSFILFRETYSNGRNRMIMMVACSMLMRNIIRWSNTVSLACCNENSRKHHRRNIITDYFDQHFLTTSHQSKHCTAVQLFHSIDTVPPQLCGEPVKFCSTTTVCLSVCAVADPRGGGHAPHPPNADPSHKWYSEYRRQYLYSIPTHHL